MNPNRSGSRLATLGLLAMTGIGVICVGQVAKADGATGPVAGKSSESKEITAPDGWVYYGGDEFDDNQLDRSKWFTFGSPKGNSPRYYEAYGHPQGMVQIYRPDHVSEANGVLTIRSKRRTDGKGYVREGKRQDGWFSGAFTSRDADTYYPLYSRVDVRAKVAVAKGVWHGIWMTSYKGASTAELDLAEFFAKRNGMDMVTQSIHLYDKKINGIHTNVTGAQDRRAKVPGASSDFHTYSVVVERAETADEAAITYLVDGQPTYSFSTGKEMVDLYNKFIEDAENDQKQERAWNIMFTGGIGGHNADVGYPDAEINDQSTEIDYIRVFVREDSPYANAQAPGGSADK